MGRLLAVALVAACDGGQVAGPDAGVDAAVFTWEVESVPTTGLLLGVWATGDGDVYAVGDAIYHSGGDGAWTEDASGAYRAVGGGYAVGETGTIAHVSGTTWSTQTSPVANLLSGVTADGGEAFAVGNLGAVLRHDGVAWGSETSGAGSADLTGVSAADGEVFAVGAGGVVQRRSGGAWATEDADTSAYLGGVFARGADDVWAVGGDLFGSQTIAHRAGGAWSVEEAPGETLYAVWADGDDVIAVGRAGTILHFDGAAWRAESSGTTADLFAISGDAAGVWIVGDGGTILRYTE